MSSLFPRTSLKRSPLTRTRKDNIPTETPSRSSTLTRRKTRPPPLQIIPELSENELGFSESLAHPPATARPTQFVTRQPELHASRITLSAYTFSIDDALLMLGDDTPRSPALSASSSVSDGTLSDDILPTPGASDDEDVYAFELPTPRLCPRRISIRPLCITKTRSLVCQEDEDIRDHFEKAEEKAFPLVIEDPLELPAEVSAAMDEEPEQDFYTREFEDFISLSPVVPSPTLSARRDSLVLTVESLTTAIEVLEPKPRGRSRHSKPLPLPPPCTPPMSSFPSIPTFPLLQTTARTSIIRRKRNVPTLPNHPSSSLLVQSRPLPKMEVPLDIEDYIFSEEDCGVPSRGPVVVEQIYDPAEDASIYSRSSFVYTTSTSTHALPPAIPENSFTRIYGEAALPRASTDSDAPRSSVDSTSSFASSAFSDTPMSPFSFSDPSSECHDPESMQRLRSRWSCSTLASLDIEPARTTTLLSPLRNVLSSRARKAPPPHVTPSKSPKNKQSSFTTPSPPSTPEKSIRRQRSRSSASSGGSNSTECDGRKGSPSGLKRKPIPLAIFLRASQ